jgi:hypothetical protein
LHTQTATLSIVFVSISEKQNKRSFSTPSMIMKNTSHLCSSPHFHHHQQHSVLQNENNKNPRNKVDRPNNNFRILKITFFMSSARNDNNNNNAVVVDDYHGVKQQNKKGFNFKKLNHHEDQDQLPPAIDLSNYLPPITYKTNKRRNRFFNDVDARNAAQALLDMSRGKFLNFDDDDVNNRDSKRIKLSNEEER